MTGRVKLTEGLTLNLSLDEAEKQFEANPTEQTATVYRAVASRYYQDGDLGRDWYEYVMDQTFDLTGRTAITKGG